MARQVLTAAEADVQHAQAAPVEEVVAEAALEAAAVEAQEDREAEAVPVSVRYGPREYPALPSNSTERITCKYHQLTCQK